VYVAYIVYIMYYLEAFPKPTGFWDWLFPHDFYAIFKAGVGVMTKNRPPEP
jgi:hypothetical protein